MRLESRLILACLLSAEIWGDEEYAFDIDVDDEDGDVKDDSSEDVNYAMVMTMLK